MKLRVCAGWSEPLLVAHITLLEISCHGSNVLIYGREMPRQICAVAQGGTMMFLFVINAESEMSGAGKYDWSWQKSPFSEMMTQIK